MKQEAWMAELGAVLAVGLSLLTVPALAQDCPEFVGACYTPGDSFGVTVSGSYAYVADGDGGLRVIDVSDSAIPFESMTETEGPRTSTTVKKPGRRNDVSILVLPSGSFGSSESEF